MEDVTREKKGRRKDNIQTLQGLAREVKDDPEELILLKERVLVQVYVGRGMSAFLGLLKQTGELGKSSGREELRGGRVKDERTYEDYESGIDLKKVVKPDTTRLNGTTT